MFASEQPSNPIAPGHAGNPHRLAPRAARACHDAAAYCRDASTPARTLLRTRRPGLATRAPQRCLVAELRA